MDRKTVEKTLEYVSEMVKGKNLKIDRNVYRGKRAVPFNIRELGNAPFEYNEKDFTLKIGDEVLDCSELDSFIISVGFGRFSATIHKSISDLDKLSFYINED